MARRDASTPPKASRKTPAAPRPDAKKQSGKHDPIGEPAPEPARPSTPLAQQIAEEAAQNTLALNPLIGMRTEDLMQGARTVLGALAAQPQIVAASS